MADAPRNRRVIVAISGASSAVYGARLLQVLRGQPGVETHLVVSDAGWKVVIVAERLSGSARSRSTTHATWSRPAPSQS